MPLFSHRYISSSPPPSQPPTIPKPQNPTLSLPQPAQTCSNGALIDRPKLLGFIGTQTGFESGDRRAALRSTWFPCDPDGILRPSSLLLYGKLEQATGLSFRFLIGRSKDAKKMALLEKEVDKYKDFMLAYFKTAFQLFEADYYVKADDDIYLRPGPVITDPHKKWYEKSGHLIGKEYFLHAYGPIYVPSAEVVASLAAARNNSLRMFSNEDVTIGSWMVAMNVHHEDNREICDPRSTPTSIAVWDIPKCSTQVGSWDCFHCLIFPSGVATKVPVNGNVAADINSGEVARRTVGYSGDDLTNVCRDASSKWPRRKIVGKKRDEIKNV
ncbi:hypothetical protein BDE02_18G043100 [Populus trichocarpa]|nr:hypothetical protein BDE02_18G043100 [Populus trichocarpa]